MESAQITPEAVGAKAPESVDVKDVFGILRRRKRWVFGVPLLLCALASTYAMLARPAYMATAQVYVDPRDRHMPKDDPLQNSVPGDGLLLVESQLKIITSDEVLTRVIEKTGLRADKEFNGERDGLISKLKALLGLGTPADRTLTTLRNLRLKTAAKRIERSFVIDIMASADTRERAVGLANALAASYLEERASANAAFNRRISEAIASRLDALRESVRESEEAVAAFKAENNLIGARNRLVTEQQLDEANTQLTNARTRLANAQSRVKMLDAIRRSGAPLDAVPEAMQSGTIVQLRARAADISREESQLAMLDGPNHPALKAVRAQQEDIQRAIKAELDRIATAVRQEAGREQANVQNLQTSFETMKTLSRTNDKVMVPLRELERTAESSRAIYESFLAKAKATEEQQVIDINNIRLITRASPPEYKSWPPTAIMLASAVLAGLAVGVALALVVENSSTKARLEPEAAPGLVEPPILEIAPAPPAHTGRRTQLDRLCEELHEEETGHTIILVRIEADAALNLMAFDLARLLEADGDDVMVIDADLSLQSVTSQLHLDASLGLRDILAGRSSIHDVARRHFPSNLKIVPAGLARTAMLENRARLALSAAMSVAREYDRVIVDGGDLRIERSDFGLYGLADELIVLAPAGRASEADVTQAVKLLRERQINARAMFVGEDIQAAAA